MIRKKTKSPKYLTLGAIFMIQIFLFLILNKTFCIFLEQCKWDKEDHFLVESDPLELMVELPPIKLIPIYAELPKKRRYECPLYKTTDRQGNIDSTGFSTNFVMYLSL